MRQTNIEYSDEGVEVDLAYDEKGRITVIHDQNVTHEEILNVSIGSQKDALHNLNLSVLIPAQYKKEVTFSNIKVRTYPVCLGDNPSCSDGVPLSIDWEYLQEYNFTVDYYERKLEKWANNPDSLLHPNRYPRKSEEDLRISAGDRLQILISAGILPHDINMTYREVEKCRQDRAASVRAYHFLATIYFFERLQRATRNATTGRASKRRERLMLKPYRNGQDEDSVEISVDGISNKSNRWFFFFNRYRRNNRVSKHKQGKPMPIVLDQSYDTASVATNTPHSIVSYNGDVLFPPTPKSNSPLNKAIKDRDTSELPRVIDMTGRVFHKNENIRKISSPITITRSPTMKRTNKPREVPFDEESEEESQLLIGEKIMVQGMDSNVDHHDGNIDRYATAQDPIISPRMDDNESTAQSIASSIFSGLNSATESAPENSSNHGSNHSHFERRSDGIRVSSVSFNSSPRNFLQVNNRIATSINVEAERGYFLNSNHRYY